MTSTDMELINLEKMEFSRACLPWRGYNCGAEAVWLAIKTCCGMEIPLCQLHKDMAVAEMADLIENVDTISCFSCEKTGIKPSWEHIRYERI